MIFEQIQSNGDRNYGYLVACESTNKAAVIDPSPDPLPCFNRAKELNLDVLYVINTHTHSDHTGGNHFFKQKTGAKLITHSLSSLGDIRVSDNETLSLGTLTLRFIHTPGHTADSMCIMVNNELATGDTLFVGKVGGTYSPENAKTEFASLKKLMELPKETRVWPGHNYGVRPSSTIGDELASNPFVLRLSNFMDFIWLKDNWAAYKVEHGIA